MISEKSTFVAEKTNKSFFEVARCNKPEVKAAVELLLGSGRERADAQPPGKVKRFSRTMGVAAIAVAPYVSLKPGQEINFGGEA